MKVNICYPGEDLWSFDLKVEDLEDVFAQFNHGSGKESKEFISQRMRSLSAIRWPMVGMPILWLGHGQAKLCNRTMLYSW